LNIPNIKLPIKKYSGLDERFPIEYNNDTEIMNLIYTNYKNMNILLRLQSQISIETKLDIIEKNIYISTYNTIDIKKGGLMNDWNFEL
jgi:hypothetical protein